MIDLVKRYVRKGYEILIFPSCDDINKQYAVSVVIYIKDNTYSIPYMCGTKDELIATMKSLDDETQRDEFFAKVEQQISNNNTQPDNEQPTEGTNT